MAVANLKKAEALQDQATLSLFTMPLDADLTDEAREYLNLRQREEMDRLKRRMEAERRATELEALAHDKVVKQRSAEVARATKSRRPPPPLSPIAPAGTPPTSACGGLPATPIASPLRGSATAPGTGKSNIPFFSHVNFVCCVEVMIGAPI